MRYSTVILIVLFLAGSIFGYDGEQINIMDFGAVGNGVTNDTAAFKAALAYDSNNVTVYVPAGTYLVGDPAGYMLLDAGWKINGDGDSSVLKLVSGTGELFHPRSNCTLSNLKIDGINGATGADPDAVIRIGFGGGDTTNYAVIDNLTFVNCNRKAILIDGAKSTTIQDCNFTDVVMAIDVVYAGPASIINNTVTNASSFGIQFWGNPDPSFEQKLCHDLLFSGNRVINGGGAGIWGTGAIGVTMTDNYIDGASDVGLDLEWCENGIISNNFVRRVRNGGIALLYGCENIIITDNVVLNDLPFTVDDGGIDHPTGIHLAPLGLSVWPDDPGHAHINIEYNRVTNEATPGRQAIWVGCAQEDVIVRDNVLTNGNLWYGGFGSESIVYQPILLPDMTAPNPRYESCEALKPLGKLMPGDFNEDCRVNMADLAVMVLDWLECNDPAIEGCQEPTFQN